MQNNSSFHVTLLSNAVAITNHIDDLTHYTYAFFEEQKSAFSN